MRDKDVRKSVWRMLEQEHAGQDDTLMLDEMGILNGTTRIDIAVINGEMTGFELKSERDTLDRLPTQRDIYNKVLDRISLVVAEKHYKKAIKIIPEWWGVWVAHPMEKETVEISRIKLPLFNEEIDPEFLCSLLWRNEALSILEELGASRGVKSKGRIEIYKRLSESLDISALRKSVRNTIKARTDWRVDRRSQ